MVAQAEPETASRPRWRNLREWIGVVDEIGELRRVTGATSEDDIGAITEMLDHTDGSPCVLFDEIPGYAAGYRVLVNAMGTRRRQAVTLGVDPAAASHDRMLDFWRDLLKSLTPIPTKAVSSGAIQENIVRDGDVDLTRFPVPIWHPLDGGRYIGTASLNILRDPDTGIVNSGSYRNQLFDRNRIGVTVTPPKHGGVIRTKYLARGEPCPIVVVVGSDPLLFLASCVEGIPYGQSELDWAGGVRRAPVEVIAGEVTGLPIPAGAEIALEGFILTDEVRKEGPYGEWMGYYQDGAPDNCVIRVDRVYHRDAPILLGCPQGKPPHEDNRFLAYLRSSMVHDQLEKAGVPGVRAVWCMPEGGNRLMTVVAIKQLYAGHAKQAGLIASQCGAAAYMAHLFVVVDDHVDVTSLQDVMWAVLTRCDPARDVEITSRTWGGPLDMASKPSDRQTKYNSRMVIDATTPFEWKDDPLAGTPICSPDRSRATRERWAWILDRESLGPLEQ